MSTHPQQQDIDRQARARALQGWTRPEAPPSGIIYQSAGRILLIGGEEALLYAPRLLPELKPQVLVIDDSDEPSVPSIPRAGRSLRVEGWMGAFRVELGEPGQRDHEVIECDLILDLAPEAVLQRELLPPGYYRPGDEPLVLDALVDELKTLRGQFEKPKFFVYDAAACAHGRNGVPGCNRCIEACPAEAIAADGDGVTVNPKLCQGGGACAAVCPSGAIGYALPEGRALQEQIRRLLRDYHQAGGSHPVIVFQAAEHALEADAFAPHLLPVSVEELASLSPEVLLAALSYGAEGLRLMEHPGLSGKSRRTIEGIVTLLRGILEPLGYDPALIDWLRAERLPLDCDAALPEGFQAASFAALGDKRQRLFQAIDHLYARAPLSPRQAPLEAGAPLGQALVDEQQCTLCLACVGACPPGALQAAGDRPGLRFIEMNCLQCGICVATCPEDAIRIEPRLLFDRELRRKPRLLHEEAPLACIVCGKPFANRRIIDTLLERLQGNPLFATEQARQRLRMCEDCRIADMAHKDPELLTGIAEVIDHD